MAVTYPVAALELEPKALRALVRLAGYDDRTAWRIQARGYVTWMAADRLAIALGAHPAIFWRSWPH